MTHVETSKSFLQRSGGTVHNFVAECCDTHRSPEILAPGNSAQNVMWLTSGGTAPDSSPLRCLQSLYICGEA